MAGTDRANPIGAILSGAMLCRWSLGREDAAAAIESAVSRALDDGVRTADLMPRVEEGLELVGTAGMAEAIVARLGAPVLGSPVLGAPVLGDPIAGPAR